MSPHTRKRQTLAAGFLLFVLGSVSAFCTPAPDTTVGKQNPTDHSWRGMVMQGKPGCPLPPATFREADLLGTWVGKPGTATFTELTLLADHTYQQVYQDPYTNLVYQSEGKPHWRLENRESGIPLLHLEKMKNCDHDTSSCEKDAQARPTPKFWGDPCEGTLLEQEDEVILLVTGVYGNSPEPYPRGIFLRYLEPDPDSNPMLLQLKED